MNSKLTHAIFSLCQLWPCGYICFVLNLLSDEQLTLSAKAIPTIFKFLMINHANFLKLIDNQ